MSAEGVLTIAGVSGIGGLVLGAVVVLVNPRTGAAALFAFSATLCGVPFAGFVVVATPRFLPGALVAEATALTLVLAAASGGIAAMLPWLLLRERQDGAG